jgi:hypothetical protein
MGDLANEPSLTMSSDQKNSFESSENPTRTSRVANLTRALSRKLLTWGVEARGACRFSREELDQP